MADRQQLARQVRKVADSRLFTGRWWTFCLVANIAFAAICALTLAWSGIETRDLSYNISIEGLLYDEKKEVHAKLLVERDSLLSPAELKAKAQKFGMKQSVPGQIRRLDLVQPRAGGR